MLNSWYPLKLDLNLICFRASNLQLHSSFSSSLVFRINLSRYICLGKTLESFITNNRLSKSLSMLSLTPGYQILTATFFPFQSMAWCTYPILAAAIGTSSNFQNFYFQSLPNCETSIQSNYFLGIIKAQFLALSNCYLISFGISSSS